jgi:cysteine desulfurase/selenocysteine lyase
VFNVRSQFPIFNQGHKTRLAFLDSAASSQKPQCVIDCLNNYYSYEHANIHRGAYSLSAEATRKYEDTRELVRKFLNSPSSNSIIFTHGTTEAVNLVSRSLENFFSEGDTILLSILEHHSNIVPWQMLAKRKNLQIKFVDITETLELDYLDLEKKLTQFKPKLLAITALANSTGTVVDVEQVIKLAKVSGALCFIDAAQAVVHRNFDVQKLQVDFLAFSGHKIYGPTGVGVLYVRNECYSLLEPYQGGGDMIETVSVSGSTWAEPPQKFEAGTPPIAEVIALAPAINFIQDLGYEAIKKHEENLFSYAHAKLSELPYLELYGPAKYARIEEQVSIISFNVKGVHAYDVGTIADTESVQLRAGHHCAMPLMKRLGLPASVRMSLAVYNDQEDVDQLCRALNKISKIFKI